MKILPESPNLDFLLREAKAVKSSHRNGVTSVCETIGHFDTSLHGLNNQQIFDTRFSIHDAQRVVARQYGFSSWSKMKHFVQRSLAGRNPSDTKLRGFVLNRFKALKSLTDDIQTKRGDYKSACKQYRKLAQDSTETLNHAYDCHGWPGPDVIGPDCVDQIMVVAGNAVYDAKFQNRTLELMGESLPTGGFFSASHAMLLDRYLKLSKQQSLYGTPDDCYYNADGECELLIPEVTDPVNLDKRRARVGFVSMESERKRCIKEAKEQNWDLPTSREQCIERSIKERDQLSSDGGYLQH